MKTIIKKIFSILWGLCYVALLFLGYYYPLTSFVLILCMVFPILISLMGHGRLWCGTLCLRGTFLQHILKPFSLKRSTPKFLTHPMTRIILLSLMMSYMIYNLYMATSIMDMASVFYTILLITTIASVILGLIFKERTWCRLCPIGTLTFIISGIRKPSLKHVVYATACYGRCHRCIDHCPMDIPIKSYHNEYVLHPDCIRCRNCAKNCPNKKIK